MDNENQPNLEEANEVKLDSVKEDNVKSGSKTTSLTFGYISLVAWLLPIVGLPVAIVGIIRAKKEAAQGVKKTGLFLCYIGLVLSLINAIFGAYQALNDPELQKLLSILFA
jgi:hypothetical protein